MKLTTTAQAILLLTSYFSKQTKDTAKPLTIAEWARFAEWLKINRISPSELLTETKDKVFEQWVDPKGKVTTDRLKELLARGHSMALALEKWMRSGLWVITRADREWYPERLLKKLGNNAPPVLYGCGNKELINSGGVAVVGSRNASPSDLLYAEHLGALAAKEGVGTVSGCARGVDETSMIGAMNAGGPVIGIMADSLLRAATSAKWRNGLLHGNLVLTSPFYPEAGFNKFNAMDRNKYIYCLSDTSVVVHSGKKGGTISGAEENLKKQWVPLWVKPTTDIDAGNASLVSKGGNWCESDINSLKISDLFQADSTIKPQEKVAQADLFSTTTQSDLFSKAEPEVLQEKTIETPTRIEEKSEINTLVSTEAELKTSDLTSVNFYELFIKELQILAMNPKSLDELLEATRLHKSQLNDWLKRAVEEGSVKKLNRPVRYQLDNKK